MLELLHIENIAVIEEADIQFRPGFNALTGETGAGKSIVIDAMGAVLGGRTSRDLIRTGTDHVPVCPFAQNGGNGIDHNGFTGTGFTGEHIKSLVKGDIRPFNDRDIFNM